MSASRCDLARRAAAAVAAALAALLACHGEIPTRPFRLSVAVVATGEPVRPAPAVAGVLRLEGAARIEGPSSAVLEDPGLGPVRLSFDSAPAPDAAFPADLDGRAAVALVQFDPDSVDHLGAPLPYPALRLGLPGAGGAPDLYRFVLAEGTYRLPDGLPQPPILAQPTLSDQDLPSYGAVSKGISFVSTSCGQEYLDDLAVIGPAGSVLLERGELGSVSVANLGLPAWAVRHVVTWHRAQEGGEGCPPGSWTQFAAWR